MNFKDRAHTQGDTAYGDVQDSEMSATHEEFDHARTMGLPVMLFVERVERREERQA